MKTEEELELLREQNRQLKRLVDLKAQELEIYKRREVEERGKESMKYFDPSSPW